ncbi:MAG: HepT-like ribonuclease domain-containing protein [Arcobacteraceae bacterium]
MSSSFEKLDFILEKIEDIESFKARYKSIEDLLNDIMGYDATLMSLLQIGETLNKLKNEPFAEKLPIKGTYDVRNFIAHDYEGVNKVIIEDIIRIQLPKLKQIILTIKRQI